MKRFIETKEADKLMNEKIFTLTIGDVISDILNDDAVSFIKIIDQQSEDWDVTIEAFKYFLEQVMIFIQEGEEDGVLSFDNNVRRFVELMKLKYSKQ